MKSIRWIIVVVVSALFFNVPGAWAQKTTPPPATPAATPATTDSQETNIRAYVELLRSDVKTKKTAVLAEIMQLSDDQAEKFWPIHREYDYELQALNDQKLAGIQEYAKNYQ